MNNSKDKKFKRTEIGMIPSDWEEVYIGNINIEIQRGGSPRPIEKYLTNSMDGVNWIKIGDTNPSDKYINSTKEKITKEGAMYSREVHKGEFLLSNSMSYGRPYILNIDGYIHDGWLVLRHFEENFNVDYLYYCLSYDIVKKQYDNLASGSGVKNLNKDIIKKVIVARPSKPEQEKIANVLIRIDNLIEDYEKLIAKKEKMRQGLMQNLLTGKERLKGFNGKWLCYKISDIYDVEKGSIITEKEIKKGNIPVIAGGKKPAYYHNAYNRNGDVITISASGANAGFVNFYNIPIFASDCITIVSNSDNSIHLLYYILNNVQKSIYELQTGGAQPHVYPINVKNLEIKLPKDTEEQCQIVRVLLNADNEINCLKIKLNKIVNIKKGMLDNLLTGKIRL